MLILLTGGSGNGKSTFALELLRQLPQPRFLVDTALVYDAEEARQRQQRHAGLQGEGITVLHQGTDLETLQFPRGGSAIVECMCHLTANEMFRGHSVFDPEADFEATCSRILRGIRQLEQRCGNLIVVTNEVGFDGIRYDESTAAYQQMLGKLNARIAARADCVCEVVCGTPVTLKGSLPARQTPEADIPTGQILVIGPENAGKREYVRSLGYREEDMSRDLHSGCPVLLDLQQLMLEHPGPVEELMPLLRKKKVILCNEVGSGIIPVSPELTRARVQTGTLCCRLARQAGQVVRVICGIATILK